MDNLREKSYDFAKSVVHCCRTIRSIKKEYILSKQLVRSGTSVGANVREARQAESKADFIHKMAIALKEASESDYWIDLLHDTDHILTNVYVQLKKKVTELIKILTAIIKNTKSNMRKGKASPA